MNSEKISCAKISSLKINNLMEKFMHNEDAQHTTKMQKTSVLYFLFLGIWTRGVLKTLSNIQDGQDGVFCGNS